MTAYLHKILILDNKVAFRSFCRSLLLVDQQFLVVDADESTILGLLQADHPDIVLLGPNLDESQRSQLLKLMDLCWPGCRILLLDDYPADEVSIARLGSSAVGVLAREDLECFLLKAVKKVYEGEAWVPRKLVHGLVERFRAQG